MEPPLTTPAHRSPRAAHLLADYWQCDGAVLDDADALEDVLRRAAHAADCEVLGALRHRFTPQGQSVVLLLSESHVSVHTWPEEHYAAVDLYTCGDGDPMRAHAVVQDGLRSRDARIRMITRGGPDGPA